MQEQAKALCKREIAGSSITFMAVCDHQLGLLAKQISPQKQIIQDGAQRHCLIYKYITHVILWQKAP